MGSESRTLVYDYFTDKNRPDLVIVNRNNSSITILSGDLSNDKILDLVVANREDNSVTVLVGLGNAFFDVHRTIPIGNIPLSIILARLGGDEQLDLAVVVQGDNTIQVLFGQGNATFKSPVLYRVGALPGFSFSANLQEGWSNRFGRSKQRSEFRQHAAQHGQRQLLSGAKSHFW